jgi:leader peptidase (prepilin peptidase)/N-methyltransferase
MAIPGPPFAGLAALGLLLGLVAGSFLATVVLRAPAGLAPTGRSRCDHCGTALAARDLVPLLSFLAGRGRCRHCRAPIAPLHPALEGLAALVGALSLGLLGLPLGLAGALFGWTLLALAALDLRHYWLPDWLTLPLLATGLATATLLDPATVPARLAAAGLAGLTLWLVRDLFRRRRGVEGLGLGDVKLAAALGAWLSPALLPPLLLSAALAGLVAAAVVRHRRRQRDGEARWPVVPFGACLAAAAWPIWLAAAAGPPGAAVQPVRTRAQMFAETTMPTLEHGQQQHGQQRNKNVIFLAQGSSIAGQPESAGANPTGKAEWTIA